MSVVFCICNLPSRFYPTFFILFDFLRRFTVSFFLPSLLAPFLCTTISTIVFHHRGRSRLYFVFHQARIHSGVKQWEASASSSTIALSLLGFLIPWCVFAGLLREDLDEFLNSRRKAYSRKALHVFSRPTYFFFLSYTCDLYSISFSHGVIQENRMFRASIKTWRPFIRRFISISNANAHCD